MSGQNSSSCASTTSQHLLELPPQPQQHQTQNQDQNQTQTQDQNQTKQPDSNHELESKHSQPLLAFPEPSSLQTRPPHEDPSDSSNSNSNKISISMAALGPVVVNSDGTMARIRNWDVMTAQEQERTMRVLGRRNLVRREKLEGEDVQGGGG